MLPIHKIREAIRIKHIRPTISARLLGRIVGASHQSVLRIDNRCQKYQVDLAVSQSLTDNELVSVLYPNITERQSSKRLPDFESCLIELQSKKGKSRAVLYLEYRAEDPETALSKTQFYRLLNKVWKQAKLSMRQSHVAGETVFIDYAGTKIYYLHKGKKVWVKVFVAVLGASKKIFALATPGEKTEHWIDGMTRMFDYYGGVTECVSMDNAKALVSKPGLIATLSRNIEAFGLHYLCFMDTCRVGHPQDKSLAELGVKFLTQRVLRLMMRNFEFFSLDDINRHLAAEVEKLNNEKFQGFDLSRNQLFEQIERKELRALPHQSFEMLVDRLICKVLPNYHVKYQKHEYSVPYEFRGETVEVIATQVSLKVVHQNQVIAEHTVKHEPMGATTLPEHMPAEHLADRMSDKTHNEAWAKTIGESALKMVELWYSKTKNPTSRYIGKRCLALKKLVNNRGESAVEDACQYALEHGMETPSDIALIIRAHAGKESIAPVSKNNIRHKNVRGKSFYGGRYAH